MNNEDIIKEFAERIKAQLLRNNNNMQLYEVDYIVEKMLENLKENS